MFFVKERSKFTRLLIVICASLTLVFSMSFGVKAQEDAKETEKDPLITILEQPEVDEDSEETVSYDNIAVSEVGDKTCFKVQIGTDFSLRDYVKVESKSEKSTLIAMGTYDTSTGGIYRINLIAIDGDGNINSKIVIVDVVEEEALNTLVVTENAPTISDKEVVRIQEALRRQAEEEEARRRAEEAARQAAIERQALAAKISAAIAALGNNASSPGQHVVDVARCYLGSSYVLGGNNPLTGVDCGGFVVYVLRQCGYNVTRGNYESKLYKISESEAKPGDIVLWSDHVAFLTAEGTLVHALNENRGVCESSFNTGVSPGYQGIYRLPGMND